MVKQIEKIMGIKIHKKFVDSPKGDVQKTHADISKAKKILNYSPNVSFEEGIRKCVDWCSNSKTKELI